MVDRGMDGLEFSLDLDEQVITEIIYIVNFPVIFNDSGWLKSDF